MDHSQWKRGRSGRGRGKPIARARTVITHAPKLRPETTRNPHTENTVSTDASTATTDRVEQNSNWEKKTHVTLLNEWITNPLSVALANASAEITTSLSENAGEIQSLADTADTMITKGLLQEAKQAAVLALDAVVRVCRGGVSRGLLEPFENNLRLLDPKNDHFSKTVELLTASDEQALGNTKLQQGCNGSQTYNNDPPNHGISHSHSRSHGHEDHSHLKPASSPANKDESKDSQCNETQGNVDVLLEEQMMAESLQRSLEMSSSSTLISQPEATRRPNHTDSISESNTVEFDNDEEDAALAAALERSMMSYHEEENYR